MSVTLTYDSTLARVQISQSGAPTTVPGAPDGTFEASVAAWSGTGGSLTQSAAQAHTGGFSAALTVSGSPAQAYVRPAAGVAVTAGLQYNVSLWGYVAGGYANGGIAIDWYDSGLNYLTTSFDAFNIPAAAWTSKQFTATAPPGAAFAAYGPTLGSSPANGTVLFVDDVEFELPGAILGSSARIERSAAGSPWQVVRGGRAITGDVLLDDYEFVPGVVNTYRVTSLSDVGVELGSESNTITPTIEQVWLKSIARPFLNMPVTVQEYGPIARKSRSGLFAVPGRSFPIRVGDVAGARSWSTTLLTRTQLEARAVEFLVASGDVLFVQVPPGYDIPGGYVDLGDVSIDRFSRTLDDTRRLINMPMSEIAAPAENVVGYTSTWAGVLADFGSWAAVLAAFPTWADLLQYIADPETVVVP